MPSKTSRPPSPDVLASSTSALVFVSQVFLHPPPAVPEPSMMVTGTLFGLGGASRVDEPAAYHADNVLYLSPEPILDNA